MMTGHRTMRRRSWRTLGAALCAVAVMGGRAQAQADTGRVDSTRVRGGRAIRDTLGVQGSIYSRPFVGGVARTSIGGYIEGNTNYIMEDGISDGFSMELRRFNIFLYSAVGPRLRFISELEFEHGTEEIALETALLDFQLDPAFVLRAGIILPPIGAFNQNHDSPRWDFVDRPLVSTRIIPATLSEVGFGAYGRVALRGGATVTYDAYLTNGLGDGVILNDEGRTLLAAGKREDQFAADNNGVPAFSGRMAVQRRGIGELGLSHYRAVYNAFRVDGVEVDERRRLSISAVDLATSVGPLAVKGEAAVVRVQTPPALAELFGDRQVGAHLDLSLPVWRPRAFGLRDAVASVVLRTEYVDFNVGTLSSTGRPARDDVVALVPGVTYRPVPGTVFKVNYRRQWSRDLLGNPASRLGGYQVGFATYF